MCVATTFLLRLSVWDCVTVAWQWLSRGWIWKCSPFLQRMKNHWGQVGRDDAEFWVIPPARCQKWQKPEQILRIITQTNGSSLKCATADARPVDPETAWMCVDHNSAGDSGFKNKPAKNTCRRHLQMRPICFWSENPNTFSVDSMKGCSINAAGQISLVASKRVWR